MKYNNDNALCEEHRDAFNLPNAAPARSLHEHADDEPVECDACAMYIMKQAGAL